MNIINKFFALSLCNIASVDAIINVFIKNNKIYVYFQKDKDIYLTTWKPKKIFTNFITELEYLVINEDNEIWTKPRKVYSNVTLLDTTKLSFVDYTFAYYDDITHTIYVKDLNPNLSQFTKTYSYPDAYKPLVCEKKCIWFQHNENIKVLDIINGTWTTLSGIDNVRKIHRYGDYIYVWSGDNHLRRLTSDFQHVYGFLLPSIVYALEFINIGGEPHCVIIDSSGKLVVFSLFELQGTSERENKIGSCYVSNQPLIPSHIKQLTFKCWPDKEYTIFIFSNSLHPIHCCLNFPLNFRRTYYNLTSKQVTQACDYYTFNFIEDNLQQRYYYNIITFYNTAFSNYPYSITLSSHYLSTFQKFYSYIFSNSYSLNIQPYISYEPVNILKDWITIAASNFVVGQIVLDKYTNTYLLIATPKSHSNLNIIRFDQSLNIIDQIEFSQSVLYPNLFITDDKNYTVTFNLCKKFGSLSFNIENDLNDLKNRFYSWDCSSLYPDSLLNKLKITNYYATTYLNYEHVFLYPNFSFVNYKLQIYGDSVPRYDIIFPRFFSHTYISYIQTYIPLLKPITDQFSLTYSTIVNSFNVNNVRNLIKENIGEIVNLFFNNKNTLTIHNLKNQTFLIDKTSLTGIQIDNSEDLIYESFHVSFILNTSVNNLTISDIQNLRFIYKHPLTNELTFLHYWIENNTLNTPYTKIWLRIPYIKAKSIIYVYMFFKDKLFTDLYEEIEHINDSNKTFDVFGIYAEGPLSSSDYVSGMIDKTKNVWDWGNGSIVYNNTSLLFSNVKAISYGFDHQAVLTVDDVLYMRGYNENGQLGNEESIYLNKWIKSYELENNDEIKCISCGSSHTLFLTKNKHVYGWGMNDKYQLGVKTIRNVMVPTVIPTSVTMELISCGNEHTLLLSTNKQLWVCGSNVDGQLGLNSINDRKELTLVPDFNNIKSIAAGGDHSLVLTEDGDVYGCGYNAYGQLGLRGTMNVLTFTKIRYVSDVKVIACGLNHSVFVTSDGDVYVCGDNMYGQLGLDLTVKFSIIPQRLSYISDIVYVVCGSNTTFLIARDGKVYGCGNNDYYQLGFKEVEKVYSFILLSHIQYLDNSLTFTSSHHTPTYFIRKYIKKEPQVTLLM